ncbi:Ammecr1l, partial [Symbiodinium microadriaticum]
DHQGRLPLDRWVEEDHDEVAKIAEEPPVVDDVPHLVVVRGTRDSWSIRTHTWLGSWVYGGLFG